MLKKCYYISRIVRQLPLRWRQHIKLIQILSRYLQLGGGRGLGSQHPLTSRRYEIVIRDLKIKDMLRFYSVMFKNATVLQKAGPD